MKATFTLLIVLLLHVTYSNAQRNCGSTSYRQKQLTADPSIATASDNIELFTRNYIAGRSQLAARGNQNIIRIPVVIHNLYHLPEEKLTDEKIAEQIAILNDCFRRRNADSSALPARFAGLGADCEIEFQLAVSDSRRHSTTGVIRKYTPVSAWNDDDKMKMESETGSKAWDATQYLNIWVCNLDRVAGYATFPGGPADKDGVVIDIGVFGVREYTTGMDKGKTVVHEIGHWLNLKHLWGDDYCGSDEVNDTPQQGTYNAGCPQGVRVSCGSDPRGDMYMNYMDFTDDACTNLFTKGQKTRMNALFANGGSRSKMLTSVGLMTPLVFESPLPEEDPTWLMPRLYPNPASSQMTLDIAYDVRWMGRPITITNINGQVMMQIIISSKQQVINVSRLTPGIYFLNGKKADGEMVREKFIKM